MVNVTVVVVHCCSWGSTYTAGQLIAHRLAIRKTVGGVHLVQNGINEG